MDKDIVDADVTSAVVCLLRSSLVVCLSFTEPPLFESVDFLSSSFLKKAKEFAYFECISLSIVNCQFASSSSRIDISFLLTFSFSSRNVVAIASSFSSSTPTRNPHASFATVQKLDHSASACNEPAQYFS